MVALCDARGTRLQHLPKQPRRIVSLVPSQTELLYHLGLKERVIGITKFCVHPKAWFQEKVRVGGTKNVNIEKLLALKPDLVLANKEENRKDDVELLAQQVPVWVTDIATLDDALTMIETIGAITNTSAKAAEILQQIIAGFEQLKPVTAQRLRVCYLIWKDPYITVGGDTFIHDMLLHAGYQNCSEETQRYPAIDLQQIQNAHCDCVLLSSEPFPFSEKHIAELQQQLPHQKMVLVDGELFSWYGSRLLQAPAYFKLLRRQLDGS